MDLQSIKLKNMNKIAFISVFFGPQPIYLHFYLNSVKNNRDFDFLIFSDWDELPIKGENLIHRQLSLEEFNDLAISKGIIQNRIINPKKLCDLKPAWSHILEDLYDNDQYEFIGYSDIDILYGDIKKFINLEILKDIDVWTATTSYMAGFCLMFRNSDTIKKLYQYNDYYRYIFNSPTHFAFDENFLVEYKNLNIDNRKVYSFTEIINELESQGKIRVKRRNNIFFEFIPDNLLYSNKKIFNLKNEELIGFHFLFVKRYLLWMFPDWKELPEKFYINKYGVYENPNSPIDLWKILFNKFYLKQLIQKISKLDLVYILKNNSFKVLYKALKQQLTNKILD